MFTSSSTRITTDEKGCRVREVFERSCATLDPSSCEARRVVFRKCPGDAKETVVESSGPAAAAPLPNHHHHRDDASKQHFFGFGLADATPPPNVDRAAPYAGRAQDV